MKNKPVLFRLTNNLGIGGIERRLRSLLPMLCDDFEVHVVTYRKKGIFFEELKDLGVHTHFLPIQNKWNFKKIYKLAKIFKQNHADIVHTHSFGANISGILAAAYATVAVRIAQVHTGLHWYASTAFGRWKQCQEERLVHSLFTHKILHVSETNLQRYAKASRINPNKLEILYNGIDIQKLKQAKTNSNLRNKLQIPEDKIIIGSLGRVVKRKGLELALDLIEKINQENNKYVFLIVGDGDQDFLQQLKKKVNNSGILRKSVIFTGATLDVAGFYRLFDMFLFLSEPNVEGMPGAFLEACCLGLPVLARVSPELKEINNYYQRIHYIDESLSNAEADIQKTLQLPIDAGIELEKKFSLDAMFKRTKDLYVRLGAKT